jgi:hypothetical protein
MEMHQQAVKVELDILCVLQFDFEFDYPVTFVKQYFAAERKTDPAKAELHQKQEDIAAHVCVDAFMLDTYSLYYPAPFIAATGVLIGLTQNVDQATVQATACEVARKFTEMSNKEFVIDERDILAFRIDLLSKKAKQTERLQSTHN